MLCCCGLIVKLQMPWGSISAEMKDRPGTFRDKAVQYIKNNGQSSQEAVGRS